VTTLPLPPRNTLNNVNDTNGKSRRRVRRVTRIVREIDPWSIFKVAIVFHFVLYIVGMVSLVLLWNVANATGTINNIENFLESFGWDSFEFKGGELFRNVWILGLFWVVLGTGIWVLLAVVFNLITELVGGIRVSVLEEEVVERVIDNGTEPTRTTPATPAMPPISRATEPTQAVPKVVEPEQ
jgi:hypothetical protein